MVTVTILDNHCNEIRLINRFFSSVTWVNWKSSPVREETKYICPTTTSWSPKRHKQQMWIKEELELTRSAPPDVSQARELSSSGRVTDKQQQQAKSQSWASTSLLTWVPMLQPYLLRHSWRIWYGDKSPALLVSSYTRESSILIWLKYCKGIEKGYCALCK